MLSVLWVAGTLGYTGAAAGALDTTAFPSSAAGVHAYTGLHGDQRHPFTARELSALGQRCECLVAMAVRLAPSGTGLRRANPSVRAVDGWDGR